MDTIVTIDCKIAEIVVVMGKVERVATSPFYWFCLPFSASHD